MPLGNADQNTVLGDWVGLQIPLWFDAGYRVWGGLVFVGAWAIALARLHDEVAGQDATRGASGALQP